jgi:1,4-alpha-glucan branching enzyme
LAPRFAQHVCDYSVQKESRIRSKAVNDDTEIYLVGDFNNWSRTSHPFARDYAGKWALTVDLEIGRIYRFHYLCDGEHWLSDSYADANVVTPYGSDNFVIMTDPKLKQLEVTQLEG